MSALRRWSWLGGLVALLSLGCPPPPGTPADAGGVEVGVDAGRDAGASGPSCDDEPDAGATTWVRCFRATPEMVVYGLAVAPDGDVVVSSTLVGTARLGAQTLGSSQTELVVTRFTPDGHVRWVKEWLGAGATNQLWMRELVVVPDGSLYGLGQFCATLRFDDGHEVHAPNDPHGGAGCSGFLVHVAEDGAVRWARQLDTWGGTLMADATGAWGLGGARLVHYDPSGVREELPTELAWSPLLAERRPDGAWFSWGQAEQGTVLNGVTVERGLWLAEASDAGVVTRARGVAFGGGVSVVHRFAAGDVGVVGRSELTNVLFYPATSVTPPSTLRTYVARLDAAWNFLGVRWLELPEGAATIPQPAFRFDEGGDLYVAGARGVAPVSLDGVTALPAGGGGYLARVAADGGVRWLESWPPRVSPGPHALVPGEGWVSTGQYGEPFTLAGVPLRTAEVAPPAVSGSVFVYRRPR